MSKYEDSIGLFPARNRTSENAPHYRGELELSVESLKELVAMAKAGKDIKMSVSAWINDWNGQKRISAKVRPWQDEPPGRSNGGRKEVDPFSDAPARQEDPFGAPKQDDVPW